MVRSCRMAPCHSKLLSHCALTVAYFVYNVMASYFSQYVRNRRALLKLVWSSREAKEEPEGRLGGPREKLSLERPFSPHQTGNKPVTQRAMGDPREGDGRFWVQDISFFCFVSFLRWQIPAEPTCKTCPDSHLLFRPSWVLITIYLVRDFLGRPDEHILLLRKS